MPAPDAWSYSGDPTSSDRDEVRFKLQDTDPAFRLLSDTELDYLIGKWSALGYPNSFIAAVAAGVIARKFAGIVTVSADGVSVNTAELAANYRAIAVDLRNEYKDEADIADVDLGNLFVGAELDASIKPLTFGEGMHDNPAAGQQDYGGVIPVPLWVAASDG